MTFSRYVRTDVVHVMPPQVRSKVLAYLFEEKELLESLPTVQLARNDEIICFYQFRKILINLNSSCIAHTVRLNMKKGWKNELDLRPWFLASVDLSGQGVYGQQNHKTPNWQKNSKSTNFLGKCGFVHYCGNWVQRRVLLLYSAIAEHDNTVSLTLRFWKSNHYLRSYRRNKINKYSETLLCTILYYTVELFWYFFWFFY